MSQNWQQPQQPGGYGYPPQQPGGYPPQQPQPQYGGGFPPPPPPAPQQQGNAGLAILVAVIAAVIGAAIYAGVLFALSDTDKGEVTKIAYLGVAVGAIVGFPIAKFGGRNQGLWVVGALLALVAVVLGELYGYALLSADYAEKMASHYPGANVDVPSANDIFFDQFGDLFDAWKKELEAWEWLFIALAPVSAYATAYRLANRR
ncbi:hypothetical protein ACZ90_06580 [Streptomyces albus subsp. albus]|nr:hypothetical protein ACZ90_06580 [Streptomyces albus subsp. albus]